MHGMGRAAASIRTPPFRCVKGPPPKYMPEATSTHDQVVAATGHGGPGLPHDGRPSTSGNLKLIESLEIEADRHDEPHDWLDLTSLQLWMILMGQLLPHAPVPVTVRPPCSSMPVSRFAASCNCATAVHVVPQ